MDDLIIKALNYENKLKRFSVRDYCNNPEFPRLYQKLFDSDSPEDVCDFLATHIIPNERRGIDLPFLFVYDKFTCSKICFRKFLEDNQL